MMSLNQGRKLGLLLTIAAGLSLPAGAAVLTIGPPNGGLKPVDTLNPARILFQGGNSPAITPVYTYSLQTGPLPPGLSLRTIQGQQGFTQTYELSGLATTPGSYPITLAVHDNLGNTGSATFTISVNSFFILGSDDWGYASIAAPFLAHVQAPGCGTSCQWSLSGAPGGLSVDSSGTISGTPAATGTFSILATATIPGSSAQTATFQLPDLPVSSAWFPPTTFPTGSATQEVYFAQLPAPSGIGPFNWSSLPSGVDSGGRLLLTENPDSGRTLHTTCYSVSVTGATGPAFTRPVCLPVPDDPRNFKTSNIQVLPSPFPNNLFRRLQDAVQGTWYRATVGLANVNECAAGPCHISLVAGAHLPAGLTASVYDASFLGNTGNDVAFLQGVPAETGSFGLTIDVADSSGGHTQQYLALNVAPFGLIPAGLSNPALPVFVTNVPYNFQLSTFGTPCSCTYSLVSGSLPDGLTLNTSGLIAGTPAVTGSYSFLVRATDGVSTFLQGYNLSYPLSLGNGHDFGFGPMVGSSSLGPDQKITDGYRYGASRLPDITVGLPVTLSFGQTFIGSPKNWLVTPGSQVPPGLLLSTTAPVTLSGTPTTSGTYSFTMEMIDTLNFTYFRKFTVTATGLTYVYADPLNRGAQSLGSSSVNLPAGSAGIGYATVLTPGLGSPPYTAALIAGGLFPPGLTLSPTGTLSGTPSQPGQFTFAVQFGDAGGATLQHEFAVTIYQAGLAVAVTSPGFTDANPEVGAPFRSQRLSGILYTGVGPFTWTLASGTLPPGLSINPAAYPDSAAITGIPTAPGLYSFGLGVTSATGQTTTIDGFLIVTSVGVSPSSIPLGAIGTPYSVSFTGFGGVPPYTISLDHFAPNPCGLSMTNGVLSGVPAYACASRLFLSVTDSAPTPVTTTAWYDLAIGGAGTVTSALSVSPALVTVPYTVGDPAPAPVTIQVGSSTQTSLPYNVAVSGATVSGYTWLTASTGAGITPGSFSLSFDPSHLTAGAYTGQVTVSAPSASNAQQVSTVTLNVSSSTLCQYSISNPYGNLAATGGSVTFNLYTGPTCAWQATAADSWYTVNGAVNGTLSGTGPAVIGYSAPPTSIARFSTLIVAGITHNIQQFGGGCSFSFGNTTIAVPVGGGSTSIPFTASASSCQWTATGASFVSIDPTTASGVGNGLVSITATANTGNTRSTTITLAGRAIAVSQTGVSCTVALSSSLDDLPYTGGNHFVLLTTPVGCPWTVSAPAWVTLSDTSGSGARGIGYSAGPNSSAQPRTGAIMFAGQALLLTQAGAPCSFTVTAPDSLLDSAAGSSASVNVQAAGSACAWTAWTGSNWINFPVTSGAGTAAVTYTAAANPSAGPRSAQITVAGQGLTVTQAGTACTYGLSAASAALDSFIAGGSVDVISPFGCPWTAVSDSAWLFVPQGYGAGSGSAGVAFGATPNTTGLARSGNLTIGGIVMPVSQPAQPCTFNAPTSLAFDANGGSNTFPYTSGAGCPIAAVTSSSGWITVDSNQYTAPNGLVSLTAARSYVGSPRTGYILVGNSQVAITQAASTCSYSMDATDISIGPDGGAGSIAVTATQSGCVPPIDDSAGLAVGPVTGSGTSYTVPYTVPAYSSFEPNIRVFPVGIGGQIVNIKQTSY